MPKATVWNRNLGDLEPTEELPPDGSIPTVRDVLKLFRYQREIAKRDKRNAAIDVATKLLERDPDACNGSLEFCVKHLVRLWDRTL